MRDLAIPDLAGVAIEYIVPNTQKRVDFIITGLDQQDKEHVVIVELKQWGEAFKVTDKDNIVSTYLGGGIREVTHPSYQAWSYCIVLLKTSMRMCRIDLLSYTHVLFYIILMKASPLSFVILSIMIY